MSGKGRGKGGGKGPPPPPPPRQRLQGTQSKPRESVANATLLERIHRHIDTHLPASSSDALKRRLVAHASFFKHEEVGSLENLKATARRVIGAVADLAWVMAARFCQPNLLSVGAALREAEMLRQKLEKTNDLKSTGGEELPGDDQLSTVAPTSSWRPVPTISDEFRTCQETLREEAASSKFASMEELIKKVAGALERAELRFAHPFEGAEQLIIEHPGKTPLSDSCLHHVSENQKYILSRTTFQKMVLDKLDVEMKSENAPKFLKNIVENANAEVHKEDLPSPKRTSRASTTSRRSESCGVSMPAGQNESTYAVPYQKLKSSESGQLSICLSHALRAILRRTHEWKCETIMALITNQPGSPSLGKQQFCKVAPRFAAAALKALGTEQQGEHRMEDYTESLELWIQILKKLPEGHAQTISNDIHAFSAVLAFDAAVKEQADEANASKIIGACFLAPRVRMHVAGALSATEQVNRMLLLGLANHVQTAPTTATRPTSSKPGDSSPQLATTTSGARRLMPVMQNIPSDVSTPEPESGEALPIPRGLPRVLAPLQSHHAVHGDPDQKCKLVKERCRQRCAASKAACTT